MTDSAYVWNSSFRERVIALCLMPDWYSRFGTSVIKPEFFETEAEERVVKFLNDFHAKYRRVPYDDELASGFDTLPNSSAQEQSLKSSVFALINRVLDLTEEDLSYAEDRAITFAQEQAMKLAILQSVEDIQSGDLARPKQRVTEALQVGMDLSDLGILLKENPRDWLVDFNDERIQTGVEHLDIVMDGGLSRGEYGVILAASNVGKTMTLVNFGFGAAGIAQRANVTHVTLEMKAKKIARRYAARITNRFLKYQTYSDLDDYVIDFEHMGKLRTPGSIRIKEWPSGTCRIEDLHAYLDRLEASGYKTDLLIIDYPDIMRHRQVGEFRHNLSNTTTELRAMADERDIVVWGASQANRSALNREIVDLDTIAEDFGKVAIADVVVALCQTKEEYGDNLMRFFGAKVRDGAKGWIIRCLIYPKAHAIVSEEILSASDMNTIRREREDEEREAAELMELTQLKSTMKEMVNA